MPKIRKQSASISSMPLRWPELKGDFLGDHVVRHGPGPLLGRFMLLVDAYLKAFDVTLRRATLADAHRLHVAHQSSWALFPPMLDPNLGSIAEDRSYALIGVNSSGEIVTSQGGHVFDLSHCSLRQIVDDQSFFYGRKDRVQPNGPRCEIWAPIAEKLHGQVVYSGALWVRPDYRGHKFASVLPRLSRAYALSQWNTDYTIAFISQANKTSRLFEMYGYSQAEDGFRMSNLANCGEVTGPLMWMHRDELIRDLARFLSSPTAEVNQIIGDSGTQYEVAQK
jgi:GNAT superfamily N-acetyltransferase